MTAVAPRSRAPARRGPWHSTPTAIAPPRSWVSLKESEPSDEAPPYRQADRQAHHQGGADPAPSHYELKRSWRARRPGRGSERDGVIVRVACRSYGDKTRA